jgi:hypothetical protein
MKILEREIGSISYAAGQTRTLELPRNYAYRSLQLKLVAQMDRADGASAGAPKDSCPAQLIQSIVIRANGRDVVKHIDMETLHRLCQIRHGTRPVIDNSGFAGYAEKSNESMIVCAQLDFAMWRAMRPIDTLLDAAGLATLELIVTFADAASVMTDAFDGTVSVDSSTLYVASTEAVGVPAGTRFMTNKEYLLRSQVSAASNSHQINLPVSNLYRSIVLKTHSDGVQVDTILNTIQIKSGTEVFKHRIAGFLQCDNRLELGVEVPEQDGSAAAIDHYYREYGLEGYYLLEFVKDGRLTESLDTSRLSGLELLLDVNHPGTNDFIDVYPVELILPPAQG